MGIDTNSRRMLRDSFLAAIGLLWLAALAVGLRTMLNYENGPAAAGSPPQAWPIASKIPRTRGLPTIVVMVHPHCPCTKATVGELALLMAHVQKRASATVVFVQPSGVPDKWEEGELWRDAHQLPGVTVIEDVGGGEAALFGALASGQTMLYDAAGQLQFSGGITASRGHSGDNAGRDAIVALISGGDPEPRETPVYGCYLQRRDAIVQDGGKTWNLKLVTKRK